MKEIKFDTAKAQQQCRKLEEIAQSLKATSEHNLEEAVQQLTHSWQGKNGKNYIKIVEKQKDSISQSRKNIEDIAVALKKITNTMIDTEEKSEEIIKIRNHM